MLARLRSAIAVLSAFARRRTLEDRLRDEMALHTDLLAEKNARLGMTPDEARRRARIALGGFDQAREELADARRFGLLEDIGRDIRYGLRSLRRSPGFTAVAILTLALGIGANTAIFSLIDSVMLRMLPVAGPGQLEQVRIRDPRGGSGEGAPTFTNALWEQVRDRQQVFSSVFAWGDQRFDLSQGGAVNFVNGIWVSGDFFTTLSLRPAAGRLIAATDDRRGCPAVAVLSYNFWHDRYAGAKSAVGSTLSLSSHPFEVIGVAPPGFFGVNVGDKFDVAVPICTADVFDPTNSPLNHRSWWWLTVVGRLKPGISRAQAGAGLAAISRQVFAGALPDKWPPEGQKNFLHKSLASVPAGNGISGLRGEFNQPLYILMAVVSLVLLIACANIASLMLARAAARQREIAVRQALGARRLGLIRQLLTECILLSCAGALVGILFARWGSALLLRYISTAEHSVFLDLSLDTRVLAFTAAVAVLTGILFGVVPALRATRVSLTSAMKGSQAMEYEPGARLNLRKWIVVSQVALSLVLLVAAGLLLRSFANLMTLDLGFDRNGVLLVRTNLRVARVPPEQQAAVFDAIESRLRSLPGVVSTARSIMTPIMGGAWNNDIQTDWSKNLTGDQSLTWFNFVSPGYFETLRMQVLAGRGFTDRDTSTAPLVAVVNQTLARRFFPNLNPIGKTFRVTGIAGKPDQIIEVVGVIKDAKYESVREDTLPTAFFAVTQATENADSQTFEVRSNLPPSSLQAAVQAAVASVNKSIPLEFRSLADQVDDSLVQERMLAVLSGFFGALALLLAMIGLYGTLSYVVIQRQAEFGLRVALGAQSRSLLWLVMRDVLSVVTGGIAIGIGLSLAATRLLQQMLFGLGSHDAVTTVTAVVVLVAVALLAGYLPARRASKVDPMVSLRAE